MAARKEIVKEFVAEGMSVGKALAIADVPKSSFYYRPYGTRKGKPVSNYTQRRDGLVGNDEVIEEINAILSDDFIDYGYERTT